jgi:hypothetical protein
MSLAGWSTTQPRKTILASWRLLKTAGAGTIYREKGLSSDH